MDETEIEQLFEPSGYLKQNICELTVVPVLLEVQSQVHVVPLQNKEHSVISKLSLKHLDNMLAVRFSGFA